MLRQPLPESRFRRIAVALKYRYGEDPAPRVVASGDGAFAETIIRQAQASRVPVHEDGKLAQVLRQVQVGSPIPEELYELVAELLLLIYRLDRKVAAVPA